MDIFLKSGPSWFERLILCTFKFQVGRLLQQLAMTGSEEGDPRTKSNLAKFDKVRIQDEKIQDLVNTSSSFCSLLSETLERTY